jgi:lactoylglutathione lyase
MKLDNVRLLVSDFEKMFLFYKNVLGFELTWGEVTGNFASFKAGESGILAIFKKEMMGRTLDALPKKPGLGSSNACLVFSVSEVDRFYSDLKSRDVGFLNTPLDMQDWGIRVVHMADPEGNVLEFFSHLDKEKWSDRLKGEDEKFTTRG